MDRKELIQKIESLRKSRVLVYVTSDRQGPVNARVAMDIIPFISRQLRNIGKTEKIDLVLYSSGGDTMVPWRLVSMIREYSDQFSVLIPYKAHSAATMNTFNPSDPQNPQNRISISVEEVMAFFDLAKNQVGIKNEEDLTRIFNKLIESSPSIHPLALGNVNRTYKLIRILAERLLKSHKEKLSKEETRVIVDALTEKLHSHQYFIGRKEAKEDLGIKTVVFAAQELADTLTELYESYRDEMNMTEIWNPEAELGEHRNVTKKAYRIAYVESIGLSNYFEISMEFRKVQQTIAQQTPQGIVNIPQEQVVWRTVGQGWKQLG
jgi:hypothetical protein